MDLDSELAQRIRLAVKAKLSELGSYRDDELPDYIMVIIANKKSRNQMIDDLSLFLDNNTDIFVNWLQGLLERLGKKEDVPVKRGSEASTQEYDPCHPGLSEDPKKSRRKLKKRIGDEEKPHKPEKKHKPESSEQLTPSPIKKKRSNLVVGANIELCVSVLHSKRLRKGVKRRHLFPSLPPDKQNKRDDLLRNLEVKSLFSRDISHDIIWLSSFPTTLGLESELSVVDRGDFIAARGPKNRRYSHIKRRVRVSNISVSDAGAHKSHRRTVSSIPGPTRDQLKNILENAELEDDNEELLKLLLEPEPVEISVQNEVKQEKKEKNPEIQERRESPVSNEPQALTLAMNTKFFVTLDGCDDSIVDGKDPSQESAVESCTEAEVKENEEKPSRTIPASLPVLSVAPVPIVHVAPTSMMPLTVAPVATTNLVYPNQPGLVGGGQMGSLVSPQVQGSRSLAARCKYWPTCRNEKSCLFHHPSSDCTMFPNCPYGGDRCFYIHPICRFNLYCTKRPHCNFTHYSPPNIEGGGTPVNMGTKDNRSLPGSASRGFGNLKYTGSESQPLCRFFPNCYKVHCPFRHK